MNTTPEMDETNKAVIKMLWFLSLAIIPLFVVFVIYINNSHVEILNFIASSTINLPAVMSAKSPLLSKVMDVYVKTAPVFAFLVFLMTHEFLRLKREKSVWKALKIYVCFTIFYTIYIYTFLFANTELTTSAKLLKLASMNNFFLLIFYICLYAAIYSLTYLYLWMGIGIYRKFKERR